MACKLDAGTTAPNTSETLLVIPVVTSYSSITKAIFKVSNEEINVLASRARTQPTKSSTSFTHNGRLARADIKVKTMAEVLFTRASRWVAIVHGHGSAEFRQL